MWPLTPFPPIAPKKRNKTPKKRENRLKRGIKTPRKGKRTHEKIIRKRESESLNRPSLFPPFQSIPSDLLFPTTWRWLTCINMSNLLMILEILSKGKDKISLVPSLHDDYKRCISFCSCVQCLSSAMRPQKSSCSATLLSAAAFCYISITLIRWDS